MSATEAEIRVAVELLRAGGLVAFPTETVYGLGADATSPAALRRLFAAKGRPSAHPVIVHVADPDAVSGWADEVSDPARRLADAFWPGPLTVILRRSSRVPDEVTGGRDTVGLRVPDQPVARALLRAFGGGLAAPSANRFGRISPTTAAAVRAELGADVDLVLDGGPCRIGIESTIVDCSAELPRIVRQGGVAREAIEAVLDHAISVADDGAVAAPGTLPSHYAPSAQVHVVGVEEACARAAELLGQGRRIGLLATTRPPGVPVGVVVLDAPGDVDEYARVLYARLREADALRLDDLIAVPPSPAGVGAAVVDRLTRAAAGPGGTPGRR